MDMKIKAMLDDDGGHKILTLWTQFWHVHL